MKSAAILIIIASSFTAAFYIIHRENCHKKNLKLLLRLVESIGNHAVFYKRSFADCIRLLEQSEEFRELTFLSDFTARVDKGEGIPEAWAKSVNNSGLYLLQPEKNVITRFCGDLCSCCSEKLSESTEIIKSNLREFIKQADTMRRERTKNTSVLTVSAGLLTVLIFL